jgi:putative ABC transport system substrate-binding protein
LSSRSPAESAGVLASFRSGLAEAGFVEGRNVSIVFRWAEGRYEELRPLAAELVRLPVSVLLAAGGSPAALAAAGATSTIPVVFSGSPDPVGLRLVASLSRPGGNVTGMSTLTIELNAKSVELLKELVPKARSFAYFVNPANETSDKEGARAFQAALALGIELHVLKASTREDVDQGFQSLKNLAVDGVVVSPDPFFDSQRDRLVALAARHAVPAAYGWREYAVAGGLMSYGANIAESYRQAGLYVGRILKGEKPADLPVMQPATFALVINLRTADALGLQVPARLIERADEVIE